MLFWDKRTLDLIDRVICVFSILCLFRNLEDGFQWIFIGVYGPTMDNLRENFWEELGAVRGLWIGPWCARGDFIAITSSEESSKGGGVILAMHRFSEVIDDLGLSRVEGMAKQSSKDLIKG